MKMIPPSVRHAPTCRHGVPVTHQCEACDAANRDRETARRMGLGALREQAPYAPAALAEVFRRTELLHRKLSEIVERIDRGSGTASWTAAEHDRLARILRRTLEGDRA